MKRIGRTYRSFEAAVCLFKSRNERSCLHFCDGERKRRTVCSFVPVNRFDPIFPKKQRTIRGLLKCTVLALQSQNVT